MNSDLNPDAIHIIDRKYIMINPRKEEMLFICVDDVLNIYEFVPPHGRKQVEKEVSLEKNVIAYAESLSLPFECGTLTTITRDGIRSIDNFSFRKN